MAINIDALLVLTVFIVCIVLVSVHFVLRPEHNDGRMLSENQSRAIGTLILVACFLILETVRNGPDWRMVVDLVLIFGAGGVTTFWLWRRFGDPRGLNRLHDKQRAEAIIKQAHEEAKEHA